MKNHELLDLIGSVNEDYVLAAGDNVVKPRSRWKAWAACAACAALVLGAYPVYRLAAGGVSAGCYTLHEYTIVEGGGILTTQDDIKTPAGGIDAPGQGIPDLADSAPGPNTMPGGAYVGDLPKYVEPGGEDLGSGIDGAYYSIPGQDIPVQEQAAAQYDNLMKNGGINPAGPNPEWYGGAWIDNSYYPEAKLAVAIVEGFRTPELEVQIEAWCGGEVVFQDAKYALAYLYALQDSVVDAVTAGADDLSCGIGVDVTANCLGVDIYSDGAAIPDSMLAELARLDPAGDAIRVRLFTQSMSTLTDEAVKYPAPGVPTADPEARAAPATEDAEPFPTPIDGDSQPDACAPDPAAVRDGGAGESAQPAGSLPGYGLIYGTGA